jgi:hypothetical protein
MRFRSPKKSRSQRELDELSTNRKLSRNFEEVGRPLQATPLKLAHMGQCPRCRPDWLGTERSCSRQLYVPWYFGTLIHMNEGPRLEIERVQTGVRMEKRILKVLKGFAEYHDMTLGDVLEGIVLHAFDGKPPFSPASLEKIRDLKKFYELDLDSSASHRLKEIKAKSGRKRKEGA